MTHPSKTASDKELKQGKEHEILQFLLHHSVEKEYAFALWRLPNNPVKNLILSFSNTTLSPSDTLEELPEGFILAPFDKQQPSNFIKADFSFSFSDGILKEATTPRQISSYEWLREVYKEFSGHAIQPAVNKKYSSGLISGESDFKNLVQICIETIEKGVFEKVVPSRKKEIDLPVHFDLLESFQKLCDAYPNAMISLTIIPSVGTWLGASPELLVSVEDKSTFKTIALAGTKAYEEGINLKHVAWTQKEIEEQALVSRYIINNFKKIRLREFDEHGPKTTIAGNLMHLKTEFTVDMKATNFPQLGSVMLQLLHPTSAVCGMPLESSLAFIQKQEGYDREYYAGYLGPVNIDNNISIFVNLRCMQLLEQKAVIYAGAGVTADSVPQSEWVETEMKMNTLLNVIL